jgi:Zn finger protein HypA/HybF involved in hydrogenase expression
METQEELQAGKAFLFEELFPVWRCPDCDQLNRYIDTFFETCGSCGKDHTLDWDEFIIKREE